MSLQAVLMWGAALLLLSTACGQDPYERLVACKKLIHAARSCADSEPWEDAVARCEARNRQQVTSLEERLDRVLTASGWKEDDTEIVPAAMHVLDREAGPRELQLQLGTARARLESCRNPDSIAGALARERGCQKRSVATWDAERKFEYEVCNEFVIDARHHGVEKAVASYSLGPSH